MSIFSPPRGTPSNKPADIVQYQDMPEVGGMKRNAVSRNALSIKKPGASGARSPAMSGRDK